MEAEEPMPLPRPLESLAAVAVGGQVGTLIEFMKREPGT